MSATNLIILLILLWATAFHALAQNMPKPTFVIKGRVTQTSSFCGGMMPTQEMMNEYTKEKPFPGKKLYVKRCKKNSLKYKIVKEITTDTAGNFEVRLPVGTYCIVEEYKTQKLKIPAHDQYTTYDAPCMKQNWAKCDYLIEVKDKDLNDVAIKYHNYCSFNQPCMHYHGPRPPAAAPRKE